MNFIGIGSSIAALAVILGAFGTHSLRGKIGYDLLEIYQTGTQYMIYHAFALILYGLAQRAGGFPAKWIGICFIAGILIFSGSLFAITFSGIRTFGAITPIGGVLLIAAWIGFAVAAWKA